MHHIIDGFTSGEWSPKMHGQVRLDRYPFACKILENFITVPQGPATSRPGWRYVVEVKDSSKSTFAIPFIFSNEQAYVLEFGENYIRFYMNQGQILSGSVPYEISSPYAAADLPELQWMQSADYLYLFHPDYPTMQLTRTGHTSWTLSITQWNDGPYLAENSDGVTHLIFSATSGSGVTVSARYMYGLLDIGTLDLTPDTPEPVMTVTDPIGGFRFKTATDGLLKTFVLNLASASVTSPNLGTARLRSDNSGSPGTLIGTSTNTVALDSTGDKEWTFASEDLDEDTWYWITFQAASPDNAITVATVTNSLDYGSGKASTAGGITDSLAVDYMVEISYQPTGRADIFDPGHVGSIWRVRHSGQSTTSTFTAGGAVSAAKKFLGIFQVDITVNTAWIGQIVLQKSSNRVQWFDAASFTTSTRQEFVETSVGVYYRLYCASCSGGSATAVLSQLEHWGVFRITNYVSTWRVSATILSDLGDTLGTPFWREGAWSGVRGYPRTGCFRDGRLYAAGTNYQLLTVWGSWVGDYPNFSPGDTDNAPVEFTLDALENPIAWLMGGKAFLVGTLGEEALLGTRKQDPISASNPVAPETLSTRGSAPRTRPIKIDQSLLFVQRGGRKVERLSYNLESDSIRPEDLTILADHITAGGITGIAYQAEPASLLFCTIAEGDLVALTYYPEQKVLGWQRLPTDGVVESISCIPSSFGDTEGRDELWAVIRRTINGQSRRFVEVLADHEGAATQADYFCVDCGLTYSGAATTTISGLGHLEGETVAVCADGAPQAQKVVVAGSIDLDVEASKVHVGLPYTCRLQPLRPEIAVQDGTSQGRMKEIERVTVRVSTTYGGRIGPDEDNLVDLPTWFEGSTQFDTAPPLRSADVTTEGWPGDAEPEGNILIVQDQPVPMTVLAIFPRVTVND